MSYDLRVSFTGLCALVYNPNAQRMRVVFVNEKSHHGGGASHEHVPVLVVRRDHWLDGGGFDEPDLTLMHSGAMHACGLVFLEGDDIEARDLGGAPLGHGLEPPPAANEHAAGPEPTEEFPATHLSWIPNVRHVLSDASRGMDASCLGGSPDAARVIARAVVDAGRVQAGEPTSTGAGAAIWRFDPALSQTPREQIIASRMEWIVSGLDAPVVLELTPFGGDSPRRVRVGPAATGAEIVDVEYHNSPWSSIFEGNEEVFPEHFPAFFRLCAQPPGQSPTPVPVRESEVIRGRKVPCMALRFDDSERA